MSNTDIEGQLREVFDEQGRLARTSNSPAVAFLLGTAPYGGGVASLLSNAAQKRQERRLRAFLLDLARDVEALTGDTCDQVNDLDEAFVLTDEFIALLEDALQEAGRVSDELKLEYMRRYVLNAARQVRPDTSWREVFRGYLLQLTGTHLRCLSYVYEHQREVGQQDRMGLVRTDTVPIGIARFIESDPFVRLRLARVCFADLANLGLLVDWRELGDAGSRHQTEYCITENGIQLMAFLSGAWTKQRHDE